MSLANLSYTFGNLNKQLNYEICPPLEISSNPTWLNYQRGYKYTSFFKVLQGTPLQSR